jgi:hypothetical protein
MMTTLAILVEHKNNLLKIIPKLSIDHVLYSKAQLINSLTSNFDLNEYHEYIDRIRSTYADIDQKNKEIIANIEAIINRIDDDISKILESKAATTNDTAKEHVMRRQLIVDETIKTIFNNKISKLSQIKYPGLQINSKFFCADTCDDIDWINYMVASDPLYLLGPNITNLEKSLSSYPEVYQKRVRLYSLDDKRNLSILPQAQFSLIFCWDFFNYLSIETIDLYLHQLIRLLRPGGTLLFTYNNCDLVDSAKLVDQDTASWATPHLLEKIYSNHGFELVGIDDIISDDINFSHVSWVELKRPGNLTTSKISQAAGLIGRK